MKKTIWISLLAALVACNSEHSYKKAEDGQDAAREFIRASLDGNYDRAKFYLLSDSTNLFLFEKWKGSYENMPADEKQRYKDANIIVVETHAENDSTTTFRYYNSFKKDTTSIKVLRVNGQWLVNLKELMNNLRR
jgi:hypothetical protein